MPLSTEKLKIAREASWQAFGRQVTFYVPGMFHCQSMRGKYQAISVTGNACELRCDHCKGRLLRSMIGATTAEALIEKAVRLAEHGNYGILISGGCDADGRLPWNRFIPAIQEIKRRTNLYISIHSGIVDDITARRLKKAGIDQALIDVIGDDKTMACSYRLPSGVSKIIASLKALEQAGIETVPHIVCGLNGGRIKGEKQAVSIVSRFNIRQVVIVSLMSLGTEWRRRFGMPRADDIVEILVEARLSMPQVAISLGCARERGNRCLETLSIDAGVNRMALPSDEAIARAESYGLAINYQPTCCSVGSHIGMPDRQPISSNYANSDETP